MAVSGKEGACAPLPRGLSTLGACPCDHAGGQDRPAGEQHCFSSRVAGMLRALTSREWSAMSLRAYSSMAAALPCSNQAVTSVIGSRPGRAAGSTRQGCTTAAKSAATAATAACAAGHARWHCSAGARQAARAHPRQVGGAVQGQHILHAHVGGVDQQAVAQPVAHLQGQPSSSRGQGTSQERQHGAAERALPGRAGPCLAAPHRFQGGAAAGATAGGGQAQAGPACCYRYHTCSALAQPAGMHPA